MTDLRVPPPAESPSSFVQRESVVPVSTTDPDVAPLLTRAFVATGRVSHLEQVRRAHALGGGWGGHAAASDSCSRGTRGT